MTSDIEGAPDPDTGRFAIWIAGGLGIAAIVAYGAYQAQQRLAARERVPAATAPVERTPNALALVAEVGTASADLDVATLTKLERELETATARTTRPVDVLQLRIARARALSVIALEASVRAGVLQGPDAARAKSETAAAISKARALTDTLSREHVQPSAVGTIEARLDLAEGHDITQIHPVVLLSDYPDQELRLAALARPLFVDDEQDPEQYDDLASSLQRAEPQTGLSTALLALAHRKAGDEARAKQALRSLLARTPGQPLAVAMQRAPVVVAVADPLPVEDPSDSAINPFEGSGGVELTGAEPVAIDPEPVIDPEPSVDPEPAVDPEPEPAVDPEPEPAVDPEPAKPEPAKPEPAKPEPAKPEPAKPEPAKPAKPKPKKPKKPKPKSSDDFDSLLAEGCKLARGGDAAEGFKLLKKAHDLKPGGAKVTLCMAQAQAKLGRDASALALVERVLRRAPNNKAALALAAKLEAGQGNRSAAEKLYRRLLAIDPDHAAAKKFLGE